MTWFANIRLLLQHFPRKVGLHGPARRCVSGVKAVYRPLCSSRHLPDAREQQQRIPACPLRQDKYCEAKKVRAFVDFLAASPVTIMKTYVALLRAANVGGTGKLPMSTLKQMCEGVGLKQVRTYIASGNIVFKSYTKEAEIKSALESRLQAYAGKPVGVLVRSAGEIAAVLARNPFRGEPGNRTVALFVDDPLPADALDHATGVRGEQLRLGEREIYIFYGDGMADSRLRIPAGNAGTARNMNTIAKLVEMATGL
jgi:uncharacterized protein (DUF1697 family)